VDEKIVSIIKKYLISFIVMGLITVGVLLLREHFTTDISDEIKFLNLADAFSIPAVVMIMAGLLVWVTSQGGFDMISYGLLRAKDSLIPGSKHSGEQFYDYKMRQDKKRPKGYSFMFISGGIYLIPAIIFNILYYTV
jgi:hypothetical protein